MADSSVKRERDDVDESLLSSLHEAPSDARKLKTDDEDKSTGKRWTSEQDDALRKAVEEHGQKNWKSIAAQVPGRNHAQCLQRWNKVLKPGLVKGHWSYEEDSILERMVLQGCHSWGEVAAHIPGRTAKQCRERWRNHLDPSINKAPFTPEEDMMIQQAYEQLGNRWTQIAELLPGRTEDAVKMRWKALNPNQKTNAKPGRPRLMPGATSSSKTRGAIPPSPDHLMATMMPLPTVGMQPMYGYPAQYDTTGAMPMGAAAAMGVPPHGHVMPPPQQAVPVQGVQDVYRDNSLPSELPEPSVEPLGEDGADDVNSKDAAILKELLRSQSNSLLSFGSSRGLSSLTDMSPEELLASGELDEMLKAVSLANEGGAPPAATSSASTTSAKSSLRFTSSFSSDRLSKAMESMASQDKHIFQELIDELRANGAPHVSHEASNNDPNLYSFSTSSGRNLLHSLDYEDRPTTSGPAQQSIAPGLEQDTGDLDDLLDSDLMKPIRKGRRF